MTRLLVVIVDEVKDGVEFTRCEGCDELVPVDTVRESDDMVLLCAGCIQLCAPETE